MRFDTHFGFSLEAHDGSFMAKVLKGGGCYEGAETRLMQSLVKSGDLCIDAGAHVGYYSCLLAHLGAKVLAIEPNPMHAEMLKRNVSGLDVTIYSVALSDVDSKHTPFYLPSKYDDGWGSLYASDLGRKHEISVRTMRLDTILDKLWPGKPIKFLKLDVEGAELPVLHGLGKRRDDVQHILVECIDVASRTAISGSSTEKIKAELSEWPSCKIGKNALFANPLSMAVGVNY